MAKYNLTSKRKSNGEITGENVQISKIDQGMPLRSHFNPKRLDTDLQKSYNKYLDFDIFEDDAPTNLDVSYHDPHSGKICHFDEMGKSMINKSDPILAASEIFNDFAWFMLENIRNLVPTSTFFSSFNAVMHLCGLYIMSSGDTETEIKNYLTLCDKTTILNGMQQVLKYVNKSECYDFKNILLVDKRFSFNKNNKDTLVTVIPVDSKNAENESNRINMYLQQTYGNMLGNIFRKEHFARLDVTCLSVGILRTVWKQPFDKIINSKFYCNDVTKIDMMCSVGKTYNYFEDNDFQILENKMYDGILAMGIILPKKYSNKVPSITIDNYNVYVNNLKPTILDEVMIPKFTKHCKLRMNSIFRKSGLVNILSTLELPKLFNGSASLTDFIQNIYLIVDEKTSVSTVQEKYTHSVNSNRKFIADKPFIYYFRCLVSNTIIIVGQFLG